ncbi:OTU-like cysteine protease [Leishmania donovani]|uniref:Ubiquitin thioesterase OTU n=1 Tax=Leishmania donovani TaxID=5661 RepID=A0A504XKZ6_LEIDO|nr:OTU-like cysteine protease family protein [Leishmania donovani]CAJ1994003.1 OTU-like cysteine protease [Leishmania donovani]VDZ49823.1 OTU-like_cysteine_protease_putative/Pfam:PF02338 [Leishmania donovani]
MSISVRIRTPKSSTPEQVELNSSGTWGEAAALLSRKSEVALERLRVLAGFPPKAVDLAADSPLSALKLRANDMLIVQEGEAKVQLGNRGERYLPPAPERAHLTRRRCPADNSCLFHACAYVLRDKSRTEGPQLRQECVQAVLDHPEMFNVNTLGMDPLAYASWLSEKDTWGGAIELEILSFLYKTEIFALDLQSVTLQRFGTGMGYTVRAFLVYTGNHYDCIAMNPVYNPTSEREDQTLFSSRDENVLARAKRFVAEEGQKMKEGKSI